jgi:multidrug efflux pump
VRIQADTQALASYGLRAWTACAAPSRRANANSAKGSFDGPQRSTPSTQRPAGHGRDYRNLSSAWRNTAPGRMSDVAQVVDSAENDGSAPGPGDRAGDHRQRAAPARRNVIATVDAIRRACRAAGRRCRPACR